MYSLVSIVFFTIFLSPLSLTVGYFDSSISAFVTSHLLWVLFHTTLDNCGMCSMHLALLTSPVMFARSILNLKEDI